MRERERESDAHKEGFTWQLHRKLFWREKPDWRLTSGSQRRRKGEGCRTTCFVPFLYEIIWEGERRDAFWRSDFPLPYLSQRLTRGCQSSQRETPRRVSIILSPLCAAGCVRAPSHRWFIEPHNKGAHNLEASLRLCYRGLICFVLYDARVSAFWWGRADGNTYALARTSYSVCSAFQCSLRGCVNKKCCDMRRAEASQTI